MSPYIYILVIKIMQPRLPQAADEQITNIFYEITPLNEIDEETHGNKTPI